MLMFRRYTMVMFVLLIVIWGSGIPIIKIGLEYCPPILFSGLRMFLGGLLMAVVAALWGGASRSPGLGTLLGYRLCLMSFYLQA